MDRNRKYDPDRSRRNRNSRAHSTHGKDRPTHEPRPQNTNRNFMADLREVVLDVFFNSRLPRRFGLEKQQVLDLLDFKPSHYFNSYLSCCICYENTLVCAIGKCDHMTCLPCSLKLTYFYNQEGAKGIHECPYCKQPNAYTYFCVNPFFVHVSKNRRFYTSRENPVMTKEELNEFLAILTHSDCPSDRDSCEILASATINIMQLYKLFLKNAAKVVNLFTQHGLVRPVANLSLGEKTAPDPHDRSGEKITFIEDFLAIEDGNMLFESAGIYYLYRLITSPLCWFPECKSRWYFNIITRENLDEALGRVSKLKFTSHKFLNRHVRGSHSMVFCEICLSYFANKKFLCELELYDLARIGDHVKNGDPDSCPPIGAHVLCPACKSYHWDMAAFRQHGKDEHFLCELCDANEDVYNVFSDYTSLFLHFKTYHYPCEEPECMFIVFADDLQLHLHYLYKHPGVTRAKSTRKPLQVVTARPHREPKSTSTSSLYSNYDDTAGYDALWDGSISIVYPESEANSTDSKPQENPLEALNNSTLGQYFTPLEPTIVTPGRDRENLEHFLGCLRGSKNLPVASDYTNNFDVTRAAHVFNDLDSLMGYFKGTELAAFDVTHYLTDVLTRIYICLTTSFTKQYSNILANCTTESVDPNALFELVKSYLTKFLLLFFNIHINKPKNDPKKVCVKLDLLKLREHNPDVKLGSNSILFLMAAVNLANISNRLIVKAAMNSLFSDMKSMWKDVDEPLSLSEAFNLGSGPQSLNNTNPCSGFNTNRNISSSALNPNTNIDQFLSKKGRGQNIVKIPRKSYIVSLKGKRVPKNKEKEKEVVPRHEPQVEPTTSIEEAPPVAEDNPTPVNVSDGLVFLDSAEVDSETLFMNHVSAGNFYGLMFDMIGGMLVANMKRFKARVLEYSLRETTKLKILNIALSQKRSFTNLGEFVSMKKLESLQSLEPEFHRLVKECNAADLASVARVWCRKCTGILRNMQVEHLEILHFYLKGNSDTCMPLRNDSEFPSLGGGADASDFSAPKNYAGAVGLKPRPKYLSEQEFPSLNQTAARPKNHRNR